MLDDITTGNTKEDGRDFSFWFVGRIEKWCKDRGIPFDEKQYGLRNREEIEVKWGIYKKGDVRNIWASNSDKTAMSILIRGDFTMIYRKADNNQERREVRLVNEGDYVIWREDLEHTWRMDKDSEILTLRWSEI